MHTRKKIIELILQDLTKMSPYERWRLCFQVLHIIITLGIPFLAVWLTKNWN